MPHDSRSHFKSHFKEFHILKLHLTLIFLLIKLFSHKTNQSLTFYLSDACFPGIKPPCCVDLTKGNVSADMVGETYREQAARHPCVKAIIFNTKNGQLCADPNAQWVKDRKLC
uniref:Chemokine interleukin-8-like domain-containing protein n=1 Tax=Oreochromis aureus TaxID=47969 RepID=A0A668V4F8_OREAU